MALARRTPGEALDVDGLPLEPGLLGTVPESLAFENGILPIHRAGDILFVAVPAGRVPVEGIAELEHLLGLGVEAIPVSEIDVPGVLVKAHQLLRQRTRAAASAPRPESPAALVPSGPELSALGIPAGILERLRQILAEPQALTLLAGPAGSGKSTSLEALAAELVRRGRSVARVGRSEGLATLEEVLRSDPDAILVDGTDSPSVTALAVRSAVEGRQVLLAVEAADAAGAAARVAEMAVDGHLLDRALRAGLAQRLLRTVCPGCREEYREDAATLEDLRLGPLLGGIPLYRGRGCTACASTGYQGRIGIFEFGERGHDRFLRGGYQPLVADALGKLLAGRTTLQEVVNQVPFTQVLQAADRLNIRRVSP